jgi:hypothetical protein
MWTIQFWKALAERVVATMIQVAIPLVTVATLNKVDWLTVFWVVVSAGALSVLKGVAAVLAGNDSPSIIDAEVLAPAKP